MLKLVGWVCLCLVVGLVITPLSAGGTAARLPPPTAAEDAAALAQRMPGLAREVIAVFKDDDRRRFLDTLFRLQTVAGQYAEAGESLAALRAMPGDGGSPQAGPRKGKSSVELADALALIRAYHAAQVFRSIAPLAAAKHRPKALKALMPSVTAAPGIDVPMDRRPLLLHRAQPPSPRRRALPAHRPLRSHPRPARHLQPPGQSADQPARL